MSNNLRIALRFLTARKRSMLMSLTGIIFGVGFFIVTQAQTSGFEQFFIRTILGTNGAIRIEDKMQDTIFAMAAAGHLPAWLAAVHPRHKVPHHAELAVGAGVILIVTVLDVGAAIGFSSFTVLTYYAVTNAAALTLSRAERRWPPAIAVAGLAGCVVIAASLRARTSLAGMAVLGVGMILFAIRRR